MKRIMWIFLFIFVLFSVSNLVQAQTAAGMERMRIGLGVAIGKELLPMSESMIIKTVDFPNFYIPIQVAPSIRVEPYFGLWRYSYTYSSSNGGSYEQKERWSLWDVGTGVFFTTWCGPVNLYFGGRIGIQKISSYSKETTEYEGEEPIEEESKGSQQNWVYGPAVGGEYFFTNNLSIGGEIQLILEKVGDWKYEDEEEPEYDYSESESYMYTRPLIFVRWYFGCK